MTRSLFLIGKQQSIWLYLLCRLYLQDFLILTIPLCGKNIPLPNIARLTLIIGRSSGNKFAALGSLLQIAL